MKKKRTLYKIIYYFLMAVVIAVTAVTVLPVLDDIKLDPSAGRIAVYLCIFAAGFILNGFLSVAVHEAGHLLSAKRNKFKLVSFTFFNRETLYTDAGRVKVPARNGFAPAACGFLNLSFDNTVKRYKKVASGGLVFSLIFLIVFLFLGAVFFFSCFVFREYIDYFMWAWVFFCTFPYFSAKILFSSFEPFEKRGTATDRFLIRAINKDRPEKKILEALLYAQAFQYEGKTLGEMAEERLFNLPVLSDDSVLIASVYFLRYVYYIDKGEFPKAADIGKRLLDLTHILAPVQNSLLCLNTVFDLVKKGDYKKAKAAAEIIKQDKSMIRDMTYHRVQAYLQKYAYKNLAAAQKEKEKALNAENLMTTKGEIEFEKKLLNNC